MLKILSLIAVLFLVYFFFFRKKSVPNKTNEKKKISETMVECSKCSTFVSSKESFIKDGNFYCSKECMLG